jgi:hypothetical protein
VSREHNRDAKTTAFLAIAVLLLLGIDSPAVAYPGAFLAVKGARSYLWAFRPPLPEERETALLGVLLLLCSAGLWPAKTYQAAAVLTELLGTGLRGDRARIWGVQPRR